MNDLEMICEAGLGDAADNTHVRLMQYEQYIAKSHLDHAVVDVIEKILFV